MNDYTPEMKSLQVDLKARLEQFMDLRYQQGAPYLEASVDASAIIGELLCVVFGCIDSPHMRQGLTEKFCNHLHNSVETAHSAAHSARPTRQ